MTDLTIPFVIGLCIIFWFCEREADSEVSDWKKLVAERHKLLELCNAHWGRVNNRLVENSPFYHELVISVDMYNVLQMDWDDITEIKKSRKKLKKMLGV